MFCARSELNIFRRCRSKWFYGSSKRARGNINKHEFLILTQRMAAAGSMKGKIMNRMKSSVDDEFDGNYDRDLEYSTEDLLDSTLEAAELVDAEFELDEWGGPDDIDLSGSDFDD